MSKLIRRDLYFTLGNQALSLESLQWRVIINSGEVILWASRQIVSLAGRREGENIAAKLDESAIPTPTVTTGTFNISGYYWARRLLEGACRMIGSAVYRDC